MGPHQSREKVDNACLKYSIQRHAEILKLLCEYLGLEVKEVKEIPKRLELRDIKLNSKKD